MTSFSKTKLARRLKEMRASKTNLVVREVGLSVVHIHSDHDEQIASGLLFTRRRSKHPIPSAHSNSNKRTPEVEILTVDNQNISYC